MFYDVRITTTGRQQGRGDTLALHKDTDRTEEAITTPRQSVQDIFVDGRDFSRPDVEEIHITATDQTVEQLLSQMHFRVAQSGLITSTPDEWYAVKGRRDGDLTRLFTDRSKVSGLVVPFEIMHPSRHRVDDIHI